MISAVIRRAAVDIWDNAVAVFALNIACLSALAIGLYALTWLALLPDVLLFLALTLALALGLAGLSALAGLVDQIAKRADIEAGPMTPDGVLCLAVAAPIMGLLFAANALISGAEAGSTLAVALTIVGLWAGCVALQLIVLTPAMALDRSLPTIDRMLWLVAVVLRFPWQILALIVLGAAALVMTVGLLPGLAGLAYLFLRAGRMLGQAFDPERPQHPPVQELRRQLIAAELLPLRSRTARNLLQPWRASE